MTEGRIIPRGRVAPAPERVITCEREPTGGISLSATCGGV